MGDVTELTVQQFVELHKAQLESSGVPRIHWEVLYSKLKNEVCSIPHVIPMNESPMNCSLLIPTK